MACGVSKRRVAAVAKSHRPDSALCNRDNSQCDQEMECVSANELEGGLKAMGQTRTHSWQCSQGAGAECGHLCSSSASPPGCILSEEPSGPSSFYAALLSVQGVPQAEATGAQLYCSLKCRCKSTALSWCLCMRLANMLHLLPVGTGITGAMHCSAVHTKSGERQDLSCMYLAHHELESV